MKGTVFAVALNHQSQMAAWLDAFNQPPYQQPAKTPVWFIKPRNTLIGHHTPIPYPQGEDIVLSGATLALVIGKTASKVSATDADQFIAGYTLANEVSLPETSFYRPAIKAKCRDGFCPLATFNQADAVVSQINANALTIITEINGQVAQQWNTADLIRSPQELLSALSEFTTLQPGDVILLGTPHQRVEIKTGDRITVRAEGFSPLENTLTQQGVLA